MIRGVLKFLLALLMPVILVFAGAGLISWSLSLDRPVEFLLWAGLILMGVGVLWGLLLFLIGSESGSFLD